MLELADVLGDQLSDEVKRTFTYGQKVVPMGGREIFNPETTDKFTEVFNSGIVDKFGARTGDGENFYNVDPTDGDQLTLTQYKVTISMEVTEMVQFFDQYGIESRLLSMSEGIGTGLVKRMEMDLQQFIKNGSAGTYTDADGNVITVQSADAVSLFSGSHTQNGTATTFDNVGAIAFGQTGIQESLNLFRKFLNHDGQRSDRRPNIIYTTSEASLTELVGQYATAQKTPEDALNAPNMYQGKYQHVVLDYLDTDTAGADDSATAAYWGMANRRGPNMKLRISKKPEIMPGEIVQRNNNVLVKGQVWYSLGVHDPIDITLHTA